MGDDPTVGTAVCGIAKFGASLLGFDDQESIESDPNVNRLDEDTWTTTHIAIGVSTCIVVLCISCTCLCVLYCRSLRMKQRKEVATMQQRAYIDESLQVSAFSMKRAKSEPRSPNGL